MGPKDLSAAGAEPEPPAHPEMATAPSLADEAVPDAVFDPFFDSVYPQLVRFGAAVWDSVPDAEEAAADAMHYLYRHWWRIPNKEAYARTMMVRAIGRLRKEAAQRARLLEHQAPADLHAVDDDGTSVSVCVNRQWIIDLFETLPPVQRAVMIGFFDGVPTRDIAEALGKTEAAIRKNLQLARTRLQLELEQQRERDRERPLPVPAATSTPRKETR
jgi:RNA polymerase sigma factor (sigma-70 family)